MCVFLPRVVVLKSASENVVCLWIKSSGTFLFFFLESTFFDDDEKIFRRKECMRVFKCVSTPGRVHFYNTTRA